MLTHHDITIPNAIEVFDEIKDSGVEFIGCKDIGLSIEELTDLFYRMRKARMTTFLEVVSNDKEKHFSGVDKAIKVKADYLIGSMPQFTRETLKYLRKKKTVVRFLPYIGRIVGHPCTLEGSIDEIVENGVEFENMGIAGINLLLYRYKGDAILLLDKLLKTLHVPLIVAGTVDSFEKIDYLKAKNIWAFTIGGAILEKKFSLEPSPKNQIEAVLERLN
jgi:hypothetical protein